MARYFILMILVGSSGGRCLGCVLSRSLLLFGTLSCLEASYEACWRGGVEGWNILFMEGWCEEARGGENIVMVQQKLPNLPI